jgi:hypothetical protein
MFSRSEAQTARQIGGAAALIEKSVEGTAGIVDHIPEGPDRDFVREEIGLAIAHWQMIRMLGNHRTDVPEKYTDAFLRNCDEISAALIVARRNLNIKIPVIKSEVAMAELRSLRSSYESALKLLEPALVEFARRFPKKQ